MTVAIVGAGGFLGRNLMKAIPDAKAIEWEDPLDFSGCSSVIHLAANADVRRGWDDPQRDLKSNLLLTSDVLEAMRRYKVRKLVFPSTGIVYRPKEGPISEDDPLEATSLYAASKIAAEQLISAYAHAGHIKATILRLVSVLGPFYTHGLIADFVKKLASNPEHLEVLAPGTSQKSYIHVLDVVEAFKLALTFDEPFGIYNVGTDATATPVQIARWITDKPIKLVGKTWAGDNPNILLNCHKLESRGWRAGKSIEQAVIDTRAWLSGTQR